MNLGTTKMRLERLADERTKVIEKKEDLLRMAEDEERDLADVEAAQLAKYRTREGELDEEIALLASDIERFNDSRDVSALLRVDEEESHPARPKGTSRDAAIYRTFGEYARDQLIMHETHGSQILPLIGGDSTAVRAEAEERLSRTLENVTSSGVTGLVAPSHVTEIMDIIDASRPVVASGRSVPLDRGSMTYPKIGTRPTVSYQSSEKSQAGSVAMTVTSETLTANTYLGASNISWQAVNWSSPAVLDLYFQLAAEAYARTTEGVACEAMETSNIGTVGTASGRLGTAGTESYGQWRTAVGAGLAAIYSATSGRHRTNTLYLSADRFFALATLATTDTNSMSPIGNLDIASMSGSFFGLRVVGSYGFDTNTAIIGDSSALLIGENAGNPVEMRVVEPAIGGWEVGLIGAFNAVVFDVNRFYDLGTHL